VTSNIALAEKMLGPPLRPLEENQPAPFSDLEGFLTQAEAVYLG